MRGLRRRPAPANRPASALTNPLSPPTAPRERLHCRTVTYDGYRRDDGFLEIEAHLVDVKDHDYALLAGLRPAGEPVHDMWVRVTLDAEFVIREIEAATALMPYPGDCDRITPAYRKLIGASLVHGFRKRLNDAVGGVHGCTHLTELLGYLPTAAFQTFAGLVPEDDGVTRPFQLNRCHALEPSSDTVRRYYPTWYRPHGSPGPRRHHAHQETTRQGEVVSDSAEETK
jgi:hypothetical protein